MQAGAVSTPPRELELVAPVLLVLPVLPVVLPVLLVLAMVPVLPVLPVTSMRPYSSRVALVVVRVPPRHWTTHHAASRARMGGPECARTSCLDTS